MANQLSGQVAIITGGSRGVGKGIALGLGAAGATVYITGRTRQGMSAAFPGSIDETAEAVSRAGGKGIALPCDHWDDAQVRAAFKRVDEEAGKLDILINNAFALYPEAATEGSFWEKPLRLVDMLDIGLRSNYVAAYHAAPIMVRQGNGLIVNISFYAASEQSQAHSAAYDAGKAGVDRMSASMAVELYPHGVTCIAFWPGFVETEFVQDLMKDDPDREGIIPGNRSGDTRI